MKQWHSVYCLGLFIFFHGKRDFVMFGGTNRPGLAIKCLLNMKEKSSIMMRVLLYFKWTFIAKNIFTLEIITTALVSSADSALPNEYYIRAVVWLNPINFLVNVAHWYCVTFNIACIPLFPLFFRFPQFLSSIITGISRTLRWTGIRFLSRRIQLYLYIA